VDTIKNAVCKKTPPINRLEQSNTLWKWVKERIAVALVKMNVPEEKKLRQNVSGVISGLMLT
jgi:hypothetical protein